MLELFFFHTILYFQLEQPGRPDRRVPSWLLTRPELFFCIMAQLNRWLVLRQLVRQQMNKHTSCYFFPLWEVSSFLQLCGWPPWREDTNLLLKDKNWLKNSYLQTEKMKTNHSTIKSSASIQSMVYLFHGNQWWWRPFPDLKNSITVPLFRSQNGTHRCPFNVTSARMADIPS